MPGVDYQSVRESVPMARVLELVQFEPTTQSGSELRGPCPIHGSTSPRSRSFAVNTEKHSFQCFKCNAKGNQLDLWAAVKKLSLYKAAIDLCNAAGVEVPWVKRW